MCLNGQCVNKVGNCELCPYYCVWADDGKTRLCLQNPQCQSELDCPSGQVCKNGVCKPPGSGNML